MDMRLKDGGNIKKVRIEQLTFRYKKDEAFSSEFFVKTVQGGQKQKTLNCWLSL